jgi:hypothetical protein
MDANVLTGLIFLTRGLIALVLRERFIRLLLGLYSEPERPLPKWRLAGRPTRRQARWAVGFFVTAAFATSAWCLTADLY